MPQMSPLMWEILFILIISMMIISVTKTYFFNSDFNSENLKNLIVKTNQKNWKW